MDEITYDEFAKMEMRVGQIMSAERVLDTDKLVKMTVDVGEESLRILVAGLGKTYTPEQLTDRKIIVLCNLQPRKIKGIESNGMLLAAGEKAEELALLGTSHDMPIGSRIY